MMTRLFSVLSREKYKKANPPSKKKYVWPDAPPPEDGESFQCFSDGYHSYKKSEVSPGKWQWVIDEESARFSREREQRRRDLLWALQTRVLTDEEMDEVRCQGYHLLTQNMVPYREEEKRREFNDLLFNQARLRSLPNPPTSEPK